MSSSYRASESRVRLLWIWGPWVFGVVTLGVLIWFSLPDRPRPAPEAWPSYADMYEAVAPSVVNVSLGGPHARVGSGFAVAPSRVVTARHLVYEADSVRIRTRDGAELVGRVVGTDARTDLALVEVEGAPALEPLTLGVSGELRVGDAVVAVGNPYGLGHWLSVGVVGGRPRTLEPLGPASRQAFLQLSVPLNPGNSGGPIFDASGRVVGVLSGTHAEGQAIAFAVPVEGLIEVLPNLERGRQVSRAFIGMRTDERDGAVVVSSVIPGGPAAVAGVRASDHVVAVDGKPVPSRAGLWSVLDALPTEGETIIRVTRRGQTLDLVVGLADRASYSLAVAGMTLRAHPGAGGRVVAIRPGSRAARAGVQVEDVVRLVDGIPVRAPADVQDRLARGEAVVLGVLRDGAPSDVLLPESS